MSKPFKKRLYDWTVVFVITHAKFNRGTKNLFALIFLPSMALAFFWGYLFPTLVRVIGSDTIIISPILARLGISAYPILAGLVFPLVLSYFMLFPLCRGTQVLMPEHFDEELVVGGEE